MRVRPPLSVSLSDFVEPAMKRGSGGGGEAEPSKSKRKEEENKKKFFFPDQLSHSNSEER